MHVIHGDGLRSLAQLGNVAVEALALDLGDLKLELGGLARTIGTSESARTPGRATVGLGGVGQLCEGSGIAKGNEGDAVVSEGREARNNGRLLSTTETTGGDEHAGELAVQLALLPELACAVQESLELSGHVTVASGDAKEEAIVVSEVAGSDDGVRRLGRCMHLGQNLLGESLGNLVDGDLTTGSFDAPLLSLGNLGDVAVEGVDDDSEVGSHV